MPINPGAGSYTPTTFAQALLTALGEPVTDPNVQAVTAWEAAEGGNWHNTAAYNPLNTTLSEPGATSINSAGVKAYTSWAQGLDATTSTLQEGPYAGIRDAMASGQDAQAVVNAVLASPWGTQSISLGNGVTSGGTGAATGATGATTASSVTGSFTGLALTAVIVLGAVGLAVLGLGRATGTRPLGAVARSVRHVA
jgi:hypothetical protein